MKLRLAIGILLAVSLKLFSQTDSLNIWWDANPEPDMSHYLLQRTVNSISNFIDLSQITHPNIHFGDSDISQGNLYGYRIAAIDTGGLISPFSPAVFAGIPKIHFDVDTLPSGRTSVIPVATIVTDPDDPPPALDISWEGLQNINLTRVAQTLRIAPDPAGYSGRALFILQIMDSDSLTDIDTVSIYFENFSANHPPVISGLPDISFSEDSTSQLDLDNYVIDVDDDTSELSWTASVLSAAPVFVGVSDLSVVIDPLTHVALFKSNIDSSGIFEVAFTVTDPQGSSDRDTITVTVNTANDSPFVANPLADVVYPEDSGPHILTDSLNTVFSDPDPGDILSFVTITSDTGIQPLITGDVLSLKLAPNYFGSGNIVLIAVDSGGLMARDTFIVTISPINDPPRVTGLPNIIIPEDSSFQFDLDSCVIDVDDDTSRLVWKAAVSNPAAKLMDTTALHVAIDSFSHKATFQVDSNITGIFGVVFTVTDTLGATDVDTLNSMILPVNDPPQISALPIIRFKEDNIFRIAAEELYNFVDDPDNPDSLLYFHISPGSYIRVTTAADTFRFTAPQDWFGEDTLILRVSDGILSDSAQIFILVESINDAPVISQLPASLEFVADSIVKLSIWDYVSDVETPDSGLIYFFQASNDSIMILYSPSTGKLSIASHPDYCGLSVLFATVKDDSGATATDSISLSINPVLLADQDSGIPKTYMLFQNYPNPFNPATIITYGVPRRSRVKLVFFNILGQQVLVLEEGEKKPGYHSVRFRGERLASGIYFYLMETNNFRQIKRMLLLK